MCTGPRTWTLGLRGPPARAAPRGRLSIRGRRCRPCGLFTGKALGRASAPPGAKTFSPALGQDAPTKAFPVPKPSAYEFSGRWHQERQSEVFKVSITIGACGRSEAWAMIFGTGRRGNRHLSKPALLNRRCFQAYGRQARTSKRAERCVRFACARERRSGWDLNQRPLGYEGKAVP